MSKTVCSFDVEIRGGMGCYVADIEGQLPQGLREEIADWGARHGDLIAEYDRELDRLSRDDHEYNQ